MDRPACKMNYIGSKYKLLDFISNTIKNYVPDLNEKVFCDLFAGTGIVARFFKSLVREVIANDVEYYSFVMIRNYVGNNILFDCKTRINELNALPGINGFLFQHYCGGGKDKRLYFSDDNGKKIDVIRTTINQWLETKLINEDEYFFYLCSLIESADKVANTASVYGAYLKKLKKTALKKMVLEPAFFEAVGSGKVFNENANDLICKVQGDILYLDPPYNERDYGANYHLLNTIARYDAFEPRGKTGLRQYKRSQYCSKREIKSVFEDLIAKARFKYVFLSYNNEGLMNCEEVASIMKKYGDYSLQTTIYSRFKADKNRTHKSDNTKEFLHCLVKNDF